MPRKKTTETETKTTKPRSRAKAKVEFFAPATIQRSYDLLKTEENPYEIGRKILETSCDNGDYLWKAVNHKLRQVNTLYGMLEALKDIYAIDLRQDKVQQVRSQVLGQFVQDALKKVPVDEFLNAVIKAKSIIEKNIFVGDFSRPDTVTIYDWVKKDYFTLSDCINN